MQLPVHPTTGDIGRGPGTAWAKLGLRRRGGASKTGSMGKLDGRDPGRERFLLVISGLRARDWSWGRGYGILSIERDFWILMACNVGRSPCCIDGRCDVAHVELSWDIQMSDHQDLTSVANWRRRQRPCYPWQKNICCQSFRRGSVSRNGYVITDDRIQISGREEQANKRRISRRCHFNFQRDIGQ
jgi:hypothetical protein